MTSVKWESTNKLGRLEVFSQAEGSIQDPASPPKSHLVSGFMLCQSELEKKKKKRKEETGREQR